jgi:hypothetical protein
MLCAGIQLKNRHRSDFAQWVPPASRVAHIVRLFGPAWNLWAARDSHGSRSSIFVVSEEGAFTFSRSVDVEKC